MLEQAAVAPLLLSRGLVERRDVSAGELRIRDVSARNTVYLAEVGDRTYVVKEGNVAHEARVLRALAEPLRGHVPEVIEADATIMVLRTHAGAEWGERHVARRF